MANAVFESGAVRIDWGGFDGTGTCLITEEMKVLISQVMEPPIVVGGAELQYPRGVIVWPTLDHGTFWRLRVDGPAPSRPFLLTGFLSDLFNSFNLPKVNISFSRTPGYDEWLLDYVRADPEAPAPDLRQVAEETLDELLVMQDILRICTERVLGLL